MQVSSQFHLPQFHFPLLFITFSTVQSQRCNIQIFMWFHVCLFVCLFVSTFPFSLFIPIRILHIFDHSLEILKGKKKLISEDYLRKFRIVKGVVNFVFRICIQDRMFIYDTYALFSEFVFRICIWDGMFIYDTYIVFRILFSEFVSKMECLLYVCIQWNQ